MMTLAAADLRAKTQLPRARGAARVSARPGPRGTALDGLRMSGSLKLLFPRPAGAALEAVLVNSAGGVTGGDSFQLEATAGEGAALHLSTQAAERVYRAADAAPGRVATRLAAGPGARLHWLPQETILFDGGRLQRRLAVDLAEGARFVMVEPVVFGRAAMGEIVRAGLFDDRVEIRRGGRLDWLDAVRLEGDIAARLDRPALGGGARAMAGLVYAGPDAAALRDRLRPLLPETAGASLVAEGLLAARILAVDGYELRRALLPALRLLTANEIPKTWML